MAFLQQAVDAPVSICPNNGLLGKAFVLIRKISVLVHTTQIGVLVHTAYEWLSPRTARSSCCCLGEKAEGWGGEPLVHPLAAQWAVECLWLLVHFQWGSRAWRCRAGLSLPAVCWQQPGGVGHSSTRGEESRTGSTAHSAAGAEASTAWEEGKWHAEKLGFSLVLEEEDLGTALTSVLPCSLASQRACLCLIALVFSPFLFVGGGV